jgi:hypothetical protein
MDPYAANPRDYDNDLTEEAFRFLFAGFPHGSEKITYCVFWGYKVAPVPDRFLSRFKDTKQDVVSYSDVKTEIVETNVTFRLKKSTHGAAPPVAMFQVVHLPPDGSGKRTMEVAWMYQDQSKREIVAVDESVTGPARFTVIRDITPPANTRTEQ